MSIETKLFLYAVVNMLSNAFILGDFNRWVYGDSLKGPLQKLHLHTGFIL